MKKTVKRILVGSGAVAAGIAAIGALSYAVTDYMVGVALDRDHPKQNSQKARTVLTGSSRLVEFARLMEDFAEKLTTVDCKTVRIIAEDSTELVGHLRIAPNAKRTILAMHGWRSSWAKDFGMIADFWHQNDCNVLYAEQRAQGESGGEYMGFGMLERHDCLSWIHYLNETGFEKLPIYLGGVSMGASTVLMSAEFDLPQNVKGIIADCGFTSAEAIWKHVARKNMHLTYTGLRAAAVNDLCRRKINMGASDCSTVEAVAKSRVPILFIHGADDRFVPVEMTYENYKACASSKRLLIVPGADHGMSYYIDQIAYESAMIDFWKNCEAAVS